MDTAIPASECEHFTFLSEMVPTWLNEEAGSYFTGCWKAAQDVHPELAVWCQA